MASCALKAQVRDSDGNIVDSKLWDDLYRITGKDRAKTKELYKIATSETFLSSVSEDAEFDRNGQITAHSFLTLSNMESMLLREADLLRRDYESTIPDDKIGMEVERFNNEPQSDKYILSAERNGKNLNLRVVARSEDSTEELYEMLHNSKTASLIADRMREIGVAYDFVGSRGYNGRFTTENAQRMSDGLYHLVELSRDSVNPVDDLVEEAAHLAVAATRNKEAVARLINAIRDMRENGMLSQLFSKEEIDASLTNPNYSDLELAGQLVKRVLMKTDVSTFSNLLGRVKSLIFKLFSKLSPKMLFKDALIAKSYAQTLANGFMFDESSVSIDEVIEHPVTLYSSKRDNINLKLAESISRRLSILNNKLMQASYNMAAQDDYMSLRPGELLGNHDMDAMSESFVSSVAAHAIDTLWTNFQKNFKILKDIDGDDFTIENTSKTNVDNLMQCIELFNSMRDICDVYRTFVSNVNIKYNKAVRDGRSDAADLAPSAKLKETCDLIDNIYSSLSDGKIAGALLTYSRILTASLMQFAFGRDEINLPSRVVFNGLKVRITREYTTDNLELATEYLKDFSYAGNAMSKVSAFIRSKKFSRDALTQTMDKIARRARLNYTRVRNDRLSELRDLQKFISENKIDDKSMYERVTVIPVVEVNDGYYVVEGKKIASTDTFEGLPVLHDVNGEWWLDDKNTHIKVDYTRKVDSGYFISQVNRRQLKIDRGIAERRVKSEFLKELKADGEYDKFINQSKDVKRAVFIKYRDSHPIWEKFISEAYVDYKNNIVSDKYINEEFNERVKDDKWRKAYEMLMNYKRAVDNQCLYEKDSFSETDENNTAGRKRFSEYKRPQYRKSFIGSYMSHRLDKADLYNSKYTRFLCEDVTSDEFGDVTTDNKLDEFNDVYSLYADGLRRLPISGINDLSDMRELSDDLIGSMFAYTDMAYRFAGAQQTFSMLEVLDYTAESRETGEFSKNQLARLNAIGRSERDSIMNTFILADEKNPAWWKRVLKVVNGFGSIVSIRLLCVSLQSAMKNYFGGISVFFKDALAGTYGFKTKDLVKAWIADRWNIKHRLGIISSKLLYKDVDFDKYQKLTERFDAFRNPRVRSNLSKKYNPFSHLINLMMANYETTDTSMIAIIYRAFMRGRFVYDVDGNEISLDKSYDYDNNNNPSLKSGLVKEKRNVEYYNLLEKARRAVEEVIKNNGNPESDQDLRVTDKYDFTELYNFISNIDLIPASKRPSVKIDLNNKSGNIKGEKEILKLINSELNRIGYTLNDEARIISEVDDYIAISQGYYGMINASQFQTNEVTATFGKLKGWLFAFMQRNYMNNINMQSGSMMYGIMATQALAFMSIFAPIENENTQTISYFKNDKMLRLQIATALIVPFALKNEKLRTSLISAGWDPDQLKGLAFGAVSWLINLGLALMAKIMRRGNRRSMGNKMKEHESRREGKHNKYRKPGMFGDFEYFNKEEFDEAFKKWKDKGYPFSNAQKSLKNVKNKITLDFPETYYTSLPRNASAGDIYYVKDKGMHYKYYDSATRKGWQPYKLGYYTYGSKEWNEHYEAIRMSCIHYDKEDPMYYVSGFAYKLLRGVTGEAMTLNDPLAMAQEIFAIPKAALFSGGISVLLNGIDTFIWGEEGSKKSWGIKEINFWLKKLPIALELDGSGKKVGSFPLWDGMHNLCLYDYYEGQDAADRFRDTNNALGIPTEEQMMFRR